MGVKDLDRCDALWAFEEIRQLKHRYFRALDTKDWALLESTLAEDCHFSLGDGEREFSSRAAFLEFQRKALSSTGIVTMHLGLAPELELDGADRARGRWALYAEARVTAAAICNRQFAFYEDEYHRESGAWSISRTAYRRVFDESEANPESRNLELGALLAHARQSE